MTWRELNVEDQRNLFIQSYLEKAFSIADLSRQFNISRKTAYKWIERFKDEGLKGLKNRSQAPLHHPNETNPKIVKEILRVKIERSKWGPKKVLGFLRNTAPHINWPSLTTVENILSKYGLVEKRKLKRRLAERTDPLSKCNASNDIWCIDFKGWSLTKDQKKCDPFTLMDAYSRYLLCCQKLPLNNANYVWAIFDRLFREYGLPVRVRSDNGPPFATLGAGRLSSLSINLIKAGVTPEWIDPGEPQQNGRHERMHLTLKQEGIDPSVDLELQLKKLDEFLAYYNFERPHEALNQKCPASVYLPSSRYWDGRLRFPEYPNGYQVERVRSCGKMSWKRKEIYIGRVFNGEPIGLKEEGENVKAYYGPIPLGIVKENSLEIARRPGRKYKK